MKKNACGHDVIARALKGIVLAGAFAVTAAEVTWKSVGAADDHDWTNPANYEGGLAPNPGDIVVVPDGVTVQVNCSDTASTNVIAGLERIRPVSATSRVVFTTENADDVLTVPCAVAKPCNDDDLAASRIGEIVKEGPGEVRLTSTLTRTVYNTKISINSGSLRLPYAPKSLGYGRMFFGQIHIAAGATLFVCSSDSYSYTYTQPTGIWGEGTICNDQPVDNWIRTSHVGGESTFAGRITGRVKVSINGRWMLTGENSDNVGMPMPFEIDKELGTAGERGVLGVKKFGNEGEPSSLGQNAEIAAGSDWFGDGGGYLYLGNGEVSNRRLLASMGLFWLDGGAYGGLELTGGLGGNSSYLPLYVLTGSNTTPCVLSGPITVKDGKSYANFKKRGTGAWRFLMTASGADRNASPTYSVEEGTLQFDSLRPANEFCALGMATNHLVGMTIWATNRHDAACQADYVFLLGNTNAAGLAATEGTLEPVAGRLGGLTNGFWTTDRPIALKGHGRLLMNAIDNGAGVERRLTLRGVKAQTVGEHVLTLDGSGTNDNTIADIVDGPEGTVSVVKEGSGTWVLAGTNTFSGELAVKAGTLVVNSARDYSWYRLAIKRLNGGAQAQVKKLSLFDADGVDQTVGITLESQWDHSVLRRGRLADGRSSIKAWGAASYLANLFTTASGFTTMMRFKMYGDANNSTWRPKDGSNGAPALDNPDTWYWLDFRLPAGAKPVTSYDMIAPLDNIDPNVKQGSNGDDMFKNSIRGWQLLGSVDGVHWDVLHEIDDAADVSGSMHYAEAGKTNYWMAAQYAYVQGEGPHTDGQPIAASLAKPFDQLANATVSVAPGATLVADGPALTINSFKASANGIGTLRNFVFAETGTLKIADAEEKLDGVVIAGTYDNVSGLENLGNWKVTGTPWRCSARVRDGKIILCRRGTALLLR